MIRQIGRAALSAMAIAMLVAVTVLVHHQTSDLIILMYWYLGASVTSGCLIAFLIGRRYTAKPVAAGRVLCIVPSYNEDPKGLHGTVKALLAQTIPVDIVVIDDGSVLSVVPTVHHPRVSWLRQENTGKRGAQVNVLRRFSRDEYQFILTVDSDSAPYPDACEHLLRAMSDPRIQAATGMIYIRNYRTNGLDRAPTSISHLVCDDAGVVHARALDTTSGALACTAASGSRPCHAYAVECDRRRPVAGATRSRRGEMVPSRKPAWRPICLTTFKGTYRQRLRWARSWWWMLPYVFRHLTLKKMLSPMYGLTQLLITPAMTGFIVFQVIVTLGGRYAGDHWQVLVAYIGAYLVIRYAGSALYLIGRPTLSLRDKCLCWIVGTPGAIILNAFLLIPIRYIALGKLFDNRWRTREVDINALPPKQDVEVAFDGLRLEWPELAADRRHPASIAEDDFGRLLNSKHARRPDELDGAVPSDEMPKPTALINGAAFPEQQEPKLATVKYRPSQSHGNLPSRRSVLNQTASQRITAPPNHPMGHRLSHGRHRDDSQRFEGRRSPPASSRLGSAPEARRFGAACGAMVCGCSAGVRARYDTFAGYGGASARRLANHGGVVDV